MIDGRSGGHRGEDRQDRAQDQGGREQGSPQRGGLPRDHEARAEVQRHPVAAAADGDGGRQPGAGRCAGGPGGDARAGPQAYRGVPGEDHRPPPHRGRGPVQAASPGER